MKFQPVLDHAVINVRDNLDVAADQYRRLGFHLTDRGHHSLGSSNHLAVFGENYLELLGFEPGRQTQRVDLWKHPLGLTGLVFKTTDSLALHSDLKAKGIPVENPAEFSRPVMLPDGEKDAAFRVVRLGPELVPNGRAFFCHHFTPELVWRDAWRQHPNGALDIVEFVVAATDPSHTADLYGSIFGRETLSAVSGGLCLRAGAASVFFLTPDEVERRYAGAAPKDLEGPQRMVALTVKTGSLAQARAVLDESGIPVVDAGSGRLVVSQEQAAGLALAFSE